MRASASVAYVMAAALLALLLVSVPAMAQKTALGKPAASFELETTGELPIAVDTVLRNEPSFEAEAVIQIRTSPMATVLEERGNWVRVKVTIDIEEYVGWVSLEDPTDGAIPLSPDNSRVDEGAVERARELLSREDRAWGEFHLLTDLGEEPATQAWLGPLLEVAVRHKQAYHERYGVPLKKRTERPVVLLFLDEKRYASYVETVDSALTAIETGGHSLGGVIAVVVGERTFEEVAALLLHELTHLRNETAFRRILPIWLEEGLAGDMGQSRVSKAGELDTHLARGSRRVKRTIEKDRQGRDLRVRAFEADGPLVSLGILVRESEGERIDLGHIFALEWEDFVLTKQRGHLYSKAGFLVRFLLSKHGATFHRFLEGVGRGESSDVGALLGHLDLTLEELESDYYAWASFRAVRAR